MSLERVHRLGSMLHATALVFQAALLHLLRVSEQSEFVDLKTAITVAALRSLLMLPPKSVTATQKKLGVDPGIKGRIWVSAYTAPVSPETGVRDAMVRAIEGLKSPEMASEDIKVPDAVPVEAEWTGYRAGATKKELPPAIPESEKYAEMMKECRSPTTILYFHGGAYWLMDPATHRPSTKLLAKLTGGRCYSVRYRLAPQNPFPAALMDALASYLTLLYPPPGAFHEAVRPEHIVFAGDSAGGNLCLALTQALLELRRQDVRISWFGAERDLPLPAGVAVNSPWTDVTHSMPSCEANAPFDYLPTARFQQRVPWPACAAWPSSPPRASFYAADALLAHPLVTVLLARDWAACPPVYVCTGRELLADEDAAMAARLHRSGAVVVFDEFQAMPHCFALLFPRTPLARRCMDGWAGFIRRAVEEPAGLESRFTSVKSRTLEEVGIDPGKLSPFTEEEVREMVLQQIDVMTASRQPGGKAKL